MANHPNRSRSVKLIRHHPTPEQVRLSNLLSAGFLNVNSPDEAIDGAARAIERGEWSGYHDADIEAVFP